MKRKIAFLVILCILFTAVFSCVNFMNTRSLQAASYFQRVNFVNGVVTSPGLNVRQGPSKNFPVVYVLKQWATVKIFGKLGDWYAIYDPATGRVGAVHSAYVKVANTTAQKTTPAPVTPAPKQTTPAQKPPTETTAPPQGITAEEQTLLNLVNKARADAGVAPLAFDMEVVKTARLKAQDMVAKNYFSHQSPTYGSPFDMMRQFGISFKTAGENIAGNRTVQAAFDAWMNSPNHKANILNASFNYTGIGIADSPTYGKIIVEQFIGR